ncbi:MAG: WecB/TagA/CpsF family glycosyltransferase [Lentisphaeria bacterium]|nr:WecB/TagA/CpsF family glycosyltransferase [Lentisphaeria bacterium]
MKILVSCVPFDNGKSGISVYMRSLVAALAAQKQELTLIVEANAVGFFPDLPKIVLPRFCGKALFSMLYFLFVLPFRIRFRKYDMAILCAANRRAFCFYPIFTAAVVHDLSQYHVQAKYDAFRMFYIKHLLPHFVRKARSVVAISASTAEDLQKFWHIPAEKIHVIHNGLSLPGEDSRSDAAPFLEKHGVRRKYILYISRLEHPGKNHVNLIRAFGLLPPELAEEYDLLLPGSAWNGAGTVFQEAERSPYADHIHFPGFVPPELLPSLYSRAACYVFPSFFEGFGLSLIEAMHFGTPCGCSNCSSLRELGEGASLLFDPADPASIASALKELLTSEECKKRLRQAGPERAKLFSWDKAASAFLRLAYRPKIFGVPCDNESMEEALAHLDALVKKRSSFCAFINAHCLNIACNDREYVEILNRADAVWPDGSGVRMAGRLLKFPVPANVNGTDMFPLICSRPYRIYMLGGAPGVAEEAMRRAKEQYPSAVFVGASPGFFADEEEEHAVIGKINRLDPDILLVAMGVPKQEKWIASHRHELVCGVALAVGGLLDFVSGRIPRAPVWMRKLGIEWCYRLYQEPRRMFRRYVLGNPLFLLRVLFRKR